MDTINALVSINLVLNVQYLNISLRVVSLKLTLEITVLILGVWDKHFVKKNT